MEHLKPSPKLWLARLAHLAAVVARPLEHVHDDHLQFLGIDIAVARELSRCPSFCGPLNGAVAKGLEIVDCSTTVGSWEEATISEDIRVLLALLGSPPALVNELARYCSAIQFYQVIRMGVERTKRKALEALFGDGPFSTALRLAPRYYPALGDRGMSISSNLRNRLGGEIFHQYGLSVEVEHQPVFLEGLSTILTFAKQVDEGLGRLLALRHPAMREAPVMPVTQHQASELKTLFARRGIQW